MICLVETPVDLANFVELHNLIMSGKGRRGTDVVIGHLAWNKKDLLSQIQADEKLYLLAHANPTNIGGYAPNKLAELLVSRGLPAHISKIVLVACSTGVSTYDYVDSGGTKHTWIGDAACVILANKLKKLFAPKKLKTKVTGFTGSAVTNPKGRTRAVDPKLASNKKAQDFYNNVIDKLFYDTKKVERWEDEAKTLPYSTPKQLRVGAQQMYAKTITFFEQLYYYNSLVTKNRMNSKLKAKAY